MSLFSGSTPAGDSVVTKRVYKGRPIILRIRVTYIDLIELDILDFNVILEMDWLHARFLY